MWHSGILHHASWARTRHHASGVGSPGHKSPLRPAHARELLWVEHHLLLLLLLLLLLTRLRTATARPAGAGLHVRILARMAGRPLLSKVRRHRPNSTGIGEPIASVVHDSRGPGRSGRRGAWFYLLVLLDRRQPERHCGMEIGGERGARLGCGFATFEVEWSAADRRWGLRAQPLHGRIRRRLGVFWRTSVDAGRATRAGPEAGRNSASSSPSRESTVIDPCGSSAVMVAQRLRATKWLKRVGC